MLPPSIGLSYGHERLRYLRLNPSVRLAWRIVNLSAVSLDRLRCPSCCSGLSSVCLLSACAYAAPPCPSLWETLSPWGWTPGRGRRRSSLSFIARRGEARRSRADPHRAPPALRGWRVPFIGRASRSRADNPSASRPRPPRPPRRLASSRCHRR